MILITGTTRGFGCDVLEHLLRSDEVSTVYAFNRKGSQPMDRQVESFRRRGLEEGLLRSSKFVMVEAELDLVGFGLDDRLLSEVSAHFPSARVSSHYELLDPRFPDSYRAQR